MNNKEKLGIGIAIAAVLLLRGGGQPPPSGPIVKKPGDTVNVDLAFEGKGIPGTQPFGFYFGNLTPSASRNEMFPLTASWQSFSRTVTLVLPLSIPPGLYAVRVFVGSTLFQDYPEVYKVED